MGGGQIGASEGEQKLRTYCLEVAGELGLEVDRPYPYWTDDYINEKRILTVGVKTNEQPLRLSQLIEFKFSYQEIEDYAQGVGTGAVNDKIQGVLEDILD